MDVDGLLSLALVIVNKAHLPVFRSTEGCMLLKVNGVGEDTVSFEW